MSLLELNELSAEANAFDRNALRLSTAQELLAKERNSPRTISEFIVRVTPNWHSGEEREAREELFSVLKELQNDIFRIAEMRLAAKAREHKVAAAHKRAIITASILPLSSEEVSNEVQDQHKSIL